jgi:two-component system response regulator DesR
MVDEHKPDLVISDIEMAGMGGIDLAEHLQTRSPSIAVVMVTTFARPGYLQRALAAGVRGYVLKDTPSRELARIIRRVMAGERIVDQQLREMAQSSDVDPLNERDRELLRLAEQGHSSKSIAAMLGKAPGTVRNHFSEVLQKLNAVNRVDACRAARQMGWL